MIQRYALTLITNCLNERLLREQTLIQCKITHQYYNKIRLLIVRYMIL